MSRVPLDGAEYTLRQPILTIVRLFIIEDMAHASLETRVRIASLFDQAKYPSSWPDMLGAKFVNRPLDLSPGEYEAILMMAPLFGVYAIGPEARSEPRWIMLSRIQKWAWNVKGLVAKSVA